MPYIITTKTPGNRNAGHYEDAVSKWSRRAVASLDDAREAVADLAGEAYGVTRGRSVGRSLLKQGGTVALPNGTVIEATPVDRRELWLRLSEPDDLFELAGGTLAIIDAYNAAQA